MCFPDNAYPPSAAVQLGVASQSDIILTAEDGNRFGAYSAEPAVPSGAGIVILPDLRGLGPYYRELAQRFAGAGVRAVAIDYFGRTAGLPGERNENFDSRPHLEKTTVETIAADGAAAAQHLRSSGPDALSLFTLGFCFGGGHSWVQGALLPGVSGAIGFYGRPSTVTPFIPQLRAPLLILRAGQDVIAASDYEQFERDLKAHGKEYEIHVYPNAPHSFFDRRFAEYAEECADAWQRMLDFIARRTQRSPGAVLA